MDDEPTTPPLPEGPRMESELTSQGRLRMLLRANAAVIESLELTDVLQQIIRAAVELVGASYGAIGVIGKDGFLEDFLYTGIDPHTAAQIGDLPRGRGLLGALIHDPRPIRLDELSHDPRSAGFPAHHPPMTSFLGVPIRARDEVYGNLYLTDHHAGSFSADDEELATALAATAGAAIANARLYAESRHRERWSAASAEITRELLSGSDDALPLVAERVLDLADADLVGVVVPTDDGDFVVRHAAGDGADTARGTRVPGERSLAAHAIDSAAPLLVDDVATSALRTFLPPEVFGPAMVVPLTTGGGVRGALSMARRRGAPRFQETELDVAASFAAQAALALELADAQESRARMTVLEDRDRIARDLHDHVIQRLFATGLGLQGVTTALGPGPHSDRLAQHVRDIDETIREIRTSIFALRSHDEQHEASLRTAVLEVVSSVDAALPHPPQVTFRGPVDLLVPESMHADVVAVVREALSNVSRHARCDEVALALSADPDRLVVEVVDDGVGTDPEAARSGLANLDDRARHHGGVLVVGPGDTEGTRLVWSVPLRGTLL